MVSFINSIRCVLKNFLSLCGFSTGIYLFIFLIGLYEWKTAEFIFYNNFELFCGFLYSDQPPRSALTPLLEAS